MQTVVIYKNWPAKGLCGRFLSEFIDWSQFLAYIQSCWCFQPSFVSVLSPVAPLPFSLVQLYPPPPPHFPVWISTLYKEFYTLYLTRFRIYTINHPKEKPRRGGGLRQINTGRKVPVQVNFFPWQRCCYITVDLATPAIWNGASHSGVLLNRPCCLLSPSCNVRRTK